MKKFEHAVESVGMAYGHPWTNLNDERGTGRSKGEHSAWNLETKKTMEIHHTRN